MLSTKQLCVVILWRMSQNLTPHVGRVVQVVDRVEGVVMRKEMPPVVVMVLQVPVTRMEHQVVGVDLEVVHLL